MAVSSLFLFSMIILFLTVSDFGLGIVDDDNDVWRCSENGPPIRFPFRRLNDAWSQPNYHGHPYPGFDISCNYINQTTLELLNGQNLLGKLYIRDIDYGSQEIQVYFDSRECLPALLLSENRSTSRPMVFPFEFRYDRHKKYTSYTLFNCSNAITKRFCSIHLVPSSLEIGQDDEFYQPCTKMYDTESISDDIHKVKNQSPEKNYVPLTWSKPDCRSCEANRKGCRLKKGSDEVECFDLHKPKKGKSKVLQVIGSTTFTALGSSVFCSIAVAAMFYLYTLYKDDREHRLRIEKFLEDYIALKPSRYTYADIKRITNQFKDKLGQGAYGTVFKGKLSNDIFVAVKILNNSKGNGEEFINEVATIGQIHHVNVVRLIGYCAEGLRRALVYEFLPNDSLDKYISFAASKGNHSISWETLHDIAIGIAKGIEYLHQGCEQRILHFDIKPHNILLVHNFKPKISDFGLAKLCSRDQSIVSMTTIRGTIGYIAPEVFSKNFGNVSYKSDVYSYGMLLLEMIGGRKNTTLTNEIYYPEWIYNLLEEGEDLRIQIEEEGDAKIARKLAIIGLWCIQWHPIGRPTMKVVVQMLGVGALTMPPNPFVSTGQLKTNSKIPARVVTLELEAIPE